MKRSNIIFAQEGEIKKSVRKIAQCYGCKKRRLIEDCLSWDNAWKVDTSCQYINKENIDWFYACSGCKTCCCQYCTELSVDAVKYPGLCLSNACTVCDSSWCYKCVPRMSSEGACVKCDPPLYKK